MEESGQYSAFAHARFGQHRHHAVHLRGAKTLPSGSAEIEKINLVSGLYLFANPAVAFLDEHGRQHHLLDPPPAHSLKQIRIDDELTLYEYETVLRLTSLISNVVCAMPATTPVTVTVDIPRVQYYFFLLTIMEEGKAPADLALEWFRQVDQRHARVSAFFRHQLATRLAPTARSDTPVRVSGTLDAIADHLYDVVTHHALPQLPDLLARLRFTADPVWQLLLDRAPPSDLTGLGHASCVVEELRAAGAHENAPPSLGIAIENHMEWKIFRQAHEVLAQVNASGGPTDSGALLGMYPLERLVITDQRKQWDRAYYHHIGRHAVDAHGSLVDLYDVAASLYP